MALLVDGPSIGRPGLPSATVARVAGPAPRIRTNSRRGATDSTHTSYPPVEAVHRAFEVLRAVNQLRIASINGIHEKTGMPKSTIVRMLETLMAEGYVARDNMCGGYRVTHSVNELTAGYNGISHIIEVARAPAIELTKRNKWPIGLGILDGDAMSIQFWTGAISPWAHTNTLLGGRADFITSAMGRAYLAFCPPEDLEKQIETFRNTPWREFDETAERRLRLLLEKIRKDGYSARDPRTKPYRTTTLAMPIRVGSSFRAAMSISFFKTAIPIAALQERIVQPLREVAIEIEGTLASIERSREGGQAFHPEKLDIEF
jgi:IclR family mhp operon transcriptional activator